MISELENHLWQSTLFACAVGLLTLVLRRNRAAVRHALWLTASVKFLVPFSLLIGIGSQVEWRKAPVVQPQVSFVMEEISHPFALPSSAPFVPAPKAPSRVPVVLFSLWLCGFAANGLAWWRRWRRVRAALRAASPLPLNLPIPVMSTPARLEPGVLGIRKPALLLPDGIADRLTPAQLHAILAHELCHVRRRDNLAAAVHMLVEALFWFHPLVWWIQARLVEERERACDEEVLRMVGDPQDYAEGILNVCKFYLESPLVCVSGVTGSNLKRRVEAIMMGCDAYGLNFGRKLLLAVAGILAVAAPLLVGIFNPTSVRAQDTRSADTPAFEVSAVRPCSPDDPGGRSSEPIGHGILKVSCMTVMDFMQSAYVSWANGHLNSPKWLRIEGGPTWIGSERYTINAKSQVDAPFEMLTGPMLQLLLEDRFKLKTHRETREIPVYALTVAKGGLELKPVPEGSCTPFDQVSVEKFLAMAAPGQKLPDLCGFEKSGRSSSGNGLTIERHAMTLAQFARGLPVDRPVIDKTGIAGMFDFRLEFALDDTTRSAVRPNSPAVALADDPSGPSIFTALQEQLGLELKPAKGPGEFLVIDSVERPLEN